MKGIINLIEFQKLRILSLLFIFVSSFEILSFSKIYFTPRDDIRSRLIELINNERKSIHSAIYMFTDKTIAQAIIDAYVRGVEIKIVLDQVSMSERFGKGLFLKKNGLNILVHTTATYNPFSMPIMHHKFFIFGLNNLYNSGLLWSGSFNCTNSASKQNDENVILTDDQGLINEYELCFQALSNRLINRASLEL